MLKQIFGDPNNRKLKSYHPIVPDINLLEKILRLSVMMIYVEKHQTFVFD